MSGADTARESARERDGRFGTQERTEDEVDLQAPQTWRLDVQYDSGGPDSIVIESTGRVVVNPYRSDSLTLVRLAGFKLKHFTDVVDLSLALALKNPGLTVGMHPIFETYEGGTTTLFADVTGLSKHDG